MDSSNKLRLNTSGGGAIAIGFVILLVGLLLTSTVSGFVNQTLSATTGNAGAQNVLNNIMTFYVLLVVLLSFALIGFGGWEMVRSKR